MREYTTSELFHMNRAELRQLDYTMAVALTRLPVPTEESAIALRNLRCIRAELSRRNFGPRF